MNVFPRSALCLALFTVAAGAHAQVNTSARTIAGTYQVVATHHCVTANEATPGVSPFTIQSGANGVPYVTVAPNTPTRALTTVANFTLVIDPTKGSLSSQDMMVNRLFLDRASNRLELLQRTHRTMQGTFTVDQATNTLLLGTRTETGTIPDDGSSSVWVWQAGARWKTADLGQTFVGAESDQPVLLEQTISSGGVVTSVNSVLCTHTVQGQRISLRF